MADKLGSVLMYLGFKRLLKFVRIDPELWTEFRVTQNCNSRCRTCYAWKNRSVDELNTQEAKNALQQLRNVGIKTIVFLGGEPLLRSDIGELIKEAALLKFEARIVVTNGLLLEDRAEELLENGVTHITISIDGFGRTNDAIRGVPGSFEKSLRGIEKIQRLGKVKGLDVKVTILTTILLNQNIEDVPKLIELSRSLGVYWSFNLLDPNVDIFNGIEFSSLKTENAEKIDETIDYLKKIRREQPGLISPDVSCNHMLDYARDYLKGKNPYDFRCVHGYRMIYLGSHGEVYPGCWVLGPLGNIRESKLLEIVRSNKYRERAKKMYMMDCPGCTNRFQPNVETKHLVSHKLKCTQSTH